MFIIGAIVLFQRYRNLAQRLILYLSVAAALDTFPYFTVCNAAIRSGVRVPC